MGRTLSTNTVSISIEPNGSTISNIPCTEGMNVQKAMEMAYAIPPGITFSIEYFGAEFGYLVLTVDGTTNENSYYWFLYVNGTLSPTGIDDTILSAGDAISLQYEIYNPATHSDAIHAVRDQAYRKAREKRA